MPWIFYEVRAREAYRNPHLSQWFTETTQTKWELFSLRSSHRKGVPVALTLWITGSEEMPFGWGVNLKSAQKVHRELFFQWGQSPVDPYKN